MNTFTDKIVDEVKEVALNLEGMYTTAEEYVLACDQLIAHFKNCRELCILNNADEFSPNDL